LGKPYGINPTWGTSWEHIENREKERKKSLPLTPKEKDWTPHECTLSFFIGCTRLLFPKLLVTIFYLGQCRGTYLIGDT
jgi:hypothetical protein